MQAEVLTARDYKREPGHPNLKFSWGKWCLILALAAPLTGGISLVVWLIVGAIFLPGRNRHIKGCESCQRWQAALKAKK